MIPISDIVNTLQILYALIPGLDVVNTRQILYVLIPVLDVVNTLQILYAALTKKLESTFLNNLKSTTGCQK